MNPEKSYFEVNCRRGGAGALARLAQQVDGETTEQVQWSERFGGFDYEADVFDLFLKQLVADLVIAPGEIKCRSATRHALSELRQLCDQEVHVVRLHDPKIIHVVRMLHLRRVAKDEVDLFERLGAWNGQIVDHGLGFFHRQFVVAVAQRPVDDVTVPAHGLALTLRVGILGQELVRHDVTATGVEVFEHVREIHSSRRALRDVMMHPLREEDVRRCSRVECDRIGHHVARSSERVVSLLFLGVGDELAIMIDSDEVGIVGAFVLDESTCEPSRTATELDDLPAALHAPHFPVDEVDQGGIRRGEIAVSVRQHLAVPRRVDNPAVSRGRFVHGILRFFKVRLLHHPSPQPVGAIRV